MTNRIGASFLLEFFNEMNSRFMFRINSGERAFSIVTIVIILDFVYSFKTSLYADLELYHYNDFHHDGTISSFT